MFERFKAWSRWKLLCSWLQQITFWCGLMKGRHHHFHHEKGLFEGFDTHPMKVYIVLYFQHFLAGELWHNITALFKTGWEEVHWRSHAECSVWNEQHCDSQGRFSKRKCQLETLSSKDDGLHEVLFRTMDVNSIAWYHVEHFQGRSIFLTCKCSIYEKEGIQMPNTIWIISTAHSWTLKQRQKNQIYRYIVPLI